MNSNSLQFDRFEWLAKNNFDESKFTHSKANVIGAWFCLLFFKLVKIKGEFTWHNHADTDETFIVLEGSMGNELKDWIVQLNEGEMCVVTHGQAHKPFADEDCRVLLGEPKGVVNTGDAGDELTDENDVWV